MSEQFKTPLPIRLFLVVAAVVLFKMVYDISQQNRENQLAIIELNKKIDKLSIPIANAQQDVERLNTGFSKIIKGIDRMGMEIGKSTRNVQLIQNDVHEEMSTIGKKISNISNQLSTIQSNTRSPFRR
ncbi:MAG: hypothetical protein HOM84_07600 [Thiotrichales bacterium]|jgi:predicted  nucleic acid-binding Zn-ribbon protein|nr:hypothetical protein [Thiotrichales bacterium]MBT3613058.1 hypothetical protein [Thiotrichales bacterium]MBT3751960.1 hypothetical protein [Thiotrichales bacterium]MBT3837664.1 hypothetical protein [Thiotrichales bacterium]MBT4152298.1 hypothetical protein [Thiotrichales bacterium]